MVSMARVAAARTASSSAAAAADHALHPAGVPVRVGVVSSAFGASSGGHRDGNVAVTRAKCLLIVVGNPLLMAKDEHWGSLLKMCVERGGYEGTPLPEDLFEREAEDSAAAEEGAV